MQSFAFRKILVQPFVSVQPPSHCLVIDLRAPAQCSSRGKQTNCRDRAAPRLERVSPSPLTRCGPLLPLLPWWPQKTCQERSTRSCGDVSYGTRKAVVHSCLTPILQPNSDRSRMLWDYVSRQQCSCLQGCQEVGPYSRRCVQEPTRMALDET